MLEPMDDWTLGEPPCDGAYPCAYSDCGDVWLYWGVDDEFGDEGECAGDEDDMTIDWPFADDQRCTRDDLMTLGFRFV